MASFERGRAGRIGPGLVRHGCPARTRRRPRRAACFWSGDLDADRDEHGHADRFWALAVHAADDLQIPLPAPLARKPIGW